MQTRRGGKDRRTYHRVGRWAGPSFGHSTGDASKAVSAYKKADYLVDAWHLLLSTTKIGNTADLIETSLSELLK